MGETFKVWFDIRETRRMPRLKAVQINGELYWKKGRRPVFPENVEPKID